MESIICRPVMLPAKDKNAPIVLYNSKENNLALRVSGTISLSGDGWNYQHLYLVSDREIKKGDYISDPSEYYSVYKSASNYKGTKLLKVEATTDKSLNLPLIPQSFIQEWVDKQGKVESVKIKVYQHLRLKDNVNKKAMPIDVYDKDNEVIILPIKESWSREEVKQIHDAFWHHLSEIPNVKQQPTFKEWFDKNY